MLQKMRAIVGVGLAGQGGAVCVAPSAAAVLQPVLLLAEADVTMKGKLVLQGGSFAAAHRVIRHCCCFASACDRP